MSPAASPRYADVIARIQDVEAATCEIIGDATGHPMWGVTFGTPAQDRWHVLLTGGVHGDEPAGVEAVVRFLEGFAAAYLERFTFHVIPCVNPSGYEAGTRLNGAGQDINRSMSDSDVIESITLRRMLQDRRFDIFFDLHEDYEATGYYMYEAQQQDRLLGAQIVETVKQEVGPIDSDANTDAGLDTPISEGLFGVNPKWREQGWSAYGYFKGANHGILPETPSTAWPLDQRVAAHHVALCIVLNHYSKESAS
jgi:hypothetical protein